MKRVQGADLAVHGTKVAIYKSQNQDFRNGSGSVTNRHNLKQVHYVVKEERPVNSASVVGAAEIRKNSNKLEKNPGVTYREVFKLSTAKLSSSAVQTKRLKEIRESVEIEDLKKLLRLLGEQRSGDGKGKLVINVDANKIYREFFQVHYDFLRNVLEETSS